MTSSCVEMLRALDKPGAQRRERAHAQRHALRRRDVSRACVKEDALATSPLFPVKMRYINPNMQICGAGINKSL